MYAIIKKKKEASNLRVGEEHGRDWSGESGIILVQLKTYLENI